jgi:hypothetical protein
MQKRLSWRPSLDSYGVLNNTGLHTPGPENHKRINVHFVYAVKHDGRYKVRLIAGGHLTDTPIDSVYSSVATLRGVRMVMFLAELNSLNFWSTNIGNGYLESNNMGQSQQEQYMEGPPVLLYVTKWNEKDSMEANQHEVMETDENKIAQNEDKDEDNEATLGEMGDQQRYINTQGSPPR